MQIKNGSLLLFRLFGVNVFVHWSWLLVAIFEISINKTRADQFAKHSPAYHIAIYLTLFLIVLIHEFGHALACKSVGGKAERIVLWPLGGLAFVQPPQRPGAVLWSIAAGPLVNVILVPLTIGAYFGLRLAAVPDTVQEFAFYLVFINAILLIFNMLPIYPLDGGQILRALLWFALGRGTSLIVAAVIGLAGAAGLALLAIYFGRIYLGIVTVFLASQSINAMRIGKILIRMEKCPRHPDVSCPHCGENPPAGEFWACACGARFDTFVTGARCPKCGRDFETTACPLCGLTAPLEQWFPPEYLMSPTVTTKQPPPAA